MTYDLCIIYIYNIIIILTDSKSPHLLRLWYILLIFDIWSHPIYSSLLGNGHPFLSPGDHRWPGCATCMHQQDSHLIAITQFSWTHGQSHGGTLNHPSHGWPFWYWNNHGDLGYLHFRNPPYCSGWIMMTSLPHYEGESSPTAAQRSEVITESTAIDDQAGLLMWWRHVESRGVKQCMVFENGACPKKLHSQ